MFAAKLLFLSNFWDASVEPIATEKEYPQIWGGCTESLGAEE